MSPSSPGMASDDLAFEIEMLLPADAQLALHAAAALFASAAALSSLRKRVVRQDARARRRAPRRPMTQRRAGRDLDLGEPRGAARLLARLRHHGEHHLAVELDLAVGEHRIVAGDRADIVLAGNIRGGQHRDDAGRGAHRVEIDAEQLPGRDRRAADRDVQQPFRLADVVDEGRAAGDVLRRGVVAQSARRTTRSRNSSARRSSCSRHRPPPGSRRRASGASRRRRSRSAPCAAARAPTSSAVLRARAQVVDRREILRQRRDRRLPVGRPSRSASRSAPSRPRARASASPPCRRRRCARRRCACRRARSLNAPITAEMSWSKRLEIL